MDFTEVKQILETFEKDFNVDVSKGLDVVIQYHISGDDGGEWKIKIKDSTCKIDEGIHDSPTVTIHMADKTWLGLANNTINPFLAFTTKKIRVKGDMSLAMQIPKIFTPS